MAFLFIGTLAQTGAAKDLYCDDYAAAFELLPMNSSFDKIDLTKRVLDIYPKLNPNTIIELIGIHEYLLSCDNSMWCRVNMTQQDIARQIRSACLENRLTTFIEGNT